MTSTTADVLFKQLTKAAKAYNVKTLKYDVDPIKLRDEFMDWIDKIKDMTYTQQDTMNLLEDYPSLPHNVDSNVNRVFAQILRAYVSKDVKAFIASVNKTDGIGDRKSTRLNSSHESESRMPSSA